MHFALSDKSMLEQLDLSHCNLQEPDIVKISSALKEASFNLSYNNISDNAASTIASIICNSVKFLDFSNCNLQEKGMSCLINASKYNSLEHLNFCGNRVTDFVATKTSAGIANNRYITYLIVVCKKWAL